MCHLIGPPMSGNHDHRCRYQVVLYVIVCNGDSIIMMVHSLGESALLKLDICS